MKTKIVLVGAALCACVLTVRADEKSDVKTPAPTASLTFELLLPNLRIYEPPEDSPFVIPLPEDKSDFTVKPPSGSVIENPGLKLKKSPAVKPVTPPALSKLPRAEMQTRVPPAQYVEKFLRDSPKWKLKDADLSGVLQTIAQVYKVKIVTCFTPEKLVEDPKLTMRLTGKTASDKLDELKVLGLVWRKTGDTYFVAWSENDLPPLQK